MIRSILFLSVILFSSFNAPQQSSSYMFVMLRPIKACGGKCNTFEHKEYPKKTAEECKQQEEALRKPYKDTPTYYTIASTEGVVYYKYYKFTGDCDCRVLGVHKSASVTKATEEMNQKVADERVKKPKAYHNFEIYSSWPR